MSDYIRIKGAKENNLKNVDLNIPRNQFVVITGLSGSGKSSLAFNTVYAEGHRRYVESLSAYARQFLGQMDKPKVDSIDGLSPTIAIDQKTSSRNPRSTVGTVTEIYDHLRLLFSRIGTPYCPHCKDIEIKPQTTQQIVDRILNFPVGTKLQLLAPLVRGKKGEHQHVFEQLLKQGFVRARVDGKVEEILPDRKLSKNVKHTIEVIVDRVVIKPEIHSRVSDSVETALKHGSGLVLIVSEDEELLLSANLSCPNCGFAYEEISPRAFSFNSPFGMCVTCHGLGLKRELSLEQSVNESLSIQQGCFTPFIKSKYYQKKIEGFCETHHIPIDIPYSSLSKKDINLLEHGDSKPFSFMYQNMMGQSRMHHSHQGFGGIASLIEEKMSEEDLDQSSDSLFHFVTCPDCEGARLKKEMLSVKIAGYNFNDVGSLSIRDSLRFFETLPLTDTQKTIVEQLEKEIVSRLIFLNEVGLGYLSLSRSANTLSGGEAQRIRLATQIGSGLTGVLYVLDEPSIGLHQRDNDRLLVSLKRLRDLGNTLLVVEHDEDTMRQADYIIDIGPMAGVHGGEVVAQGTYEELLHATHSLTADYLSGRRFIEVPKKRRKPKDMIDIVGATENNLKKVSVSIPLGVMCSVTGVSGSGKSTLVNHILYKSLHKRLNPQSRLEPGKHSRMSNLDAIDKIINIDQSPIGRTPRSNPATYIGVFNDIRDLFASTKEAKLRGYQAGRFSFNVKSGRCEACKGDGLVKIEMHFLSDVYVTCDVCAGKRYGRETLEIEYKRKNIYDILEMTIDEAVEFFDVYPKIKNKLKTIQDVGLGYIKLGQPATTLSGGEAQRVKLASELSKRSTGKTMYILDEPTTGLHIYDVHKLLHVLDRLVEKGNSIVIIEHNLDVIKYSDYLIDLGPEGGDEGGEIIAFGTPEKVALNKKSYTAHFLKPLLDTKKKGD